MFNETAHSVLVRERLLPCRVVVGSMGCIVYTDYVYTAFVPLLANISCLLFLFRKFFFVCLFFVCLFVCCSSFFLSHHAFILFYWPFCTRLLACLIRAAICICLFVCICSHPDALSSVVLISDLLYQSAAFVFPDGSRVSELVMVSLAFHLSLAQLFLPCALMAFDFSRPLVCCRQ